MIHSFPSEYEEAAKKPGSWKIAAITQIFQKKETEEKIEIYRLVSILDIDGKILEKYIIIAF